MARYKYQDIVRDGNGIIVSSATISVYLAGTTTAASVYTASAGGVAVHSVTSSTDGTYYFYVDTSDYPSVQSFKLIISHSAFDPVTIDNIYITELSEGAVNGIATLNASSKVVQEPASKAQASGIASLDANSRLVQPATTVYDGVANRSASVTPGANIIPVSNASGAIPSGFGGIASSLATTDASNRVVQPATSLYIASQAQGDVLYFNGSIWTRLAAGTSGQILQTQGPSANPQWATYTAGQLIYDSVAASVSYPCTTVTINPPLTGITHGGYRYEFRIVNTSGSPSVYRMFYNNDTTTTNYDYYGSTSGNDAGLYNVAGINSDTYMVNSGFINVFPYDSTHYQVTAYGLVQLSAFSTKIPSASPVIFVHTYRVSILTATDLNRIDITASLSNGICAYSRFRLWRQT